MKYRSIVLAGALAALFASILARSWNPSLKVVGLADNPPGRQEASPFNSSPTRISAPAPDLGTDPSLWPETRPATFRSDLLAAEPPAPAPTDATIQPARARLPLAIVAADPATIPDETRTRLLLHLSDRFLEATDLPPGSHPENLQSWESAQESSDDKFRLYFGAQTYQQHQTRRARQELFGSTPSPASP